MPLEILPYEIKCSILEALPFVASLEALVHASPEFHAVYRSRRKELLALATIHDLQDRNVEILAPRSFVDIRIMRSAWRDDGRRILMQAVFDCYRKAQTKQIMRLELLECRALMQLKDFVRYWVEKEDCKDVVYCLGAKRYDERTESNVGPEKL